MKVTMAPGRYYLGDPCYVFPESGRQWDNFCDERRRRNDGIVVIDGHRIVAFSTDRGDGVYEEKDGRAVCAVESGMIGLVPVAFFGHDEYRRGGADAAGIVIEFGRSFECSAKRGVLTFGEYVIDTRVQAVFTECEEMVWPAMNPDD